MLNTNQLNIQKCQSYLIVVNKVHQSWGMTLYYHQIKVRILKLAIQGRPNFSFTEMSRWLKISSLKNNNDGPLNYKNKMIRTYTQIFKVSQDQKMFFQCLHQLSYFIIWLSTALSELYVNILLQRINREAVYKVSYMGDTILGLNKLTLPPNLTTRNKKEYKPCSIPQS